MAKAKAVKGCINDNCIAKKERNDFRAVYEYCPRCGQPLVWVCKRCRTVLADGTKKYCVRCENWIKDKKDHPVDTIVSKVADVVTDVADDIKDAAINAFNKDKGDQEGENEQEN